MQQTKRRVSAQVARGLLLVVGAIGLVCPLQARPFDPASKPADKATDSPQPTGAEIQVNTVTTGEQAEPVVAPLPDGFFVIWTSDASAGTDSDGTSVQARQFSSVGSPEGGQFQVNASTANGQYDATVASWPDGRFVVVWNSTETFIDLFAQVYDSSGAVITPEFEIPTSTAGRRASVVTASGDRFVVTWTSYPADGDGTGVQVAVYDADGTNQALMPLNSYTTGDQDETVVREAPDGTFVAAWKSGGSAGTDTDQSSVQIRRLASDGTPQGADFQVNTYTTGEVAAVQLAFTDAGEFLVVWGNDGGSPGGDEDGAVVARRFDSTGSPIGEDFQVNSLYTVGFQSPTDLRTTPNDGFIVVWEGDAVGSDDPSMSAVVSRRFDSCGMAVGDEMLLNTLTSGDQAEARLAVDPDGGFLVVWSSDESAGDDVTKSIQARRYRSDIFQDGFESGDTSAWSATIN